MVKAASSVPAPRPIPVFPTTRLHVETAVEAAIVVLKGLRD
jgi:hypothetical protein